MEQPVGRLISAIHRKIHQRVTNELKDNEIDIGQFFFLRYILKNEGISQEKMAQNLFLDKTTASKGIKRLLRLGYVERSVNPKDRRQFQLYTTEKAKVLAPEFDKIYLDTQDVLMKNLSEEEKVSIRKILIKIIKNLKINNLNG